MIPLTSIQRRADTFQHRRMFPACFLCDHLVTPLTYQLRFRRLERTPETLVCTTSLATKTELDARCETKSPIREL